MIKLITTVGTSIITNFKSNEVQRAISHVTKNNNAKIDTLYDAILEYPDKSDIDELSSIISSYFLTNMTKKSDCWEYSKTPTELNIHCCAEVYSIVKLMDKYVGETFEVYLLTTDTPLSGIAGKLISDTLKKSFPEKIVNVDIRTIKGLQVTNSQTFSDQGFFNLIDEVHSIKNESTNTVLNISGGYKAVIPVLTLLAQLEEIIIYYIYEDSTELIEIGNLPINFDWGIIEKYVEIIKNNNKRNKADENLIQELRDLKLIKSENRDLSIVGELISRYAEKMSPYTAIIFGYLIEYKLVEYYAKLYGGEKVLHSYEPVKGLGDIDIFIKDKANTFIAVEIKPFNRLLSESYMQTIRENYSKRIKPLINPENQISEIWLILYSYSKEKTDAKELDKSTKMMLSEYTEALKQDFGDDTFTFRVKHFFIHKNKLSSEKHIYQTFMKSSIKDNAVSDLFSSK